MKVSKQLIREREIQKLNSILGTDEATIKANMKSEMSDKETQDKEYLLKDLFTVSHKKN